MTTEPEYPEHEKLKDLNGANQIVGDFIEWLDMNGYAICRYVERSEAWARTGKPTTTLIAEHFGIDEAKLEDEKVAMLEAFRKSHERAAS